jgi:DNA-binding XRE family transcriptional regulator
VNSRNVFPLGGETFPRSLFGRPTRGSYRAAVAQIIRDVKSQHKLSNVALADVVGVHEDTIENAENEAGNLDPVTLLNIAYAFGEDAIAPVRELYLCAPADPPTPVDRLARIEAETAMLRRELA